MKQDTESTKLDRLRNEATRLQEFIDTAGDLVDALQAARAAAAHDIKDTRLLKVFVNHWRKAHRLIGSQRNGLSAIGHRLKWKVSIDGVVEPGWHLALRSIVDQRLVDPLALAKNIEKLPDKLPKSTKLPDGVPMPLSPTQLALLANSVLAADCLDPGFIERAANLKFEVERERQFLRRRLAMALKKLGIARTPTCVDVDLREDTVTVDGATYRYRSPYAPKMLDELRQTPRGQRIEMKELKRRIGHSNVYAFAGWLRKRPELMALLAYDRHSVGLKSTVIVRTKQVG